MTKDTLPSLLRLFFKNWKFILRYVLLTSIVAAIISLFLPNVYKGVTVFYPASSDIIKPEHIFGSTNSEMEYYGDGNDLDRMITLAYSHRLLTSMIDSFDLFNRYKIDSTAKFSEFKVIEAFKDNYKVEKNKYDAIELSVEDKDPVIAASMANAARQKIDEFTVLLWKSNLLEMNHTLEDIIKSKNETLIFLNDTIKQLRQQYSIIDPGTQSEMLAEKVLFTESKLQRERERLKVLIVSPGIRKDTISMIKAMVAGLESEYKSLTNKDSKSLMNMNQFNQGRNELEIYLAQQKSNKDYLNNYLSRKSQINGLVESKISSTHIIENANIPLMKESPKRSYIVAGAFIIALFVCLFFVILRDTLSNPDWKKLWSA